MKLAIPINTKKFKNSREAIKWFRKAASQGHAQSQFNLGFLYHTGHGVAQNNKEAIKWFRKAANQGNIEAQYNLGVIFFIDPGPYQNYNEALIWFLKAASQGYAPAQSNLGTMYNTGHGVDQDHNEALRWYRLAANQGYVDAQTNLGVMYVKNQGVSQDYKEAIKWWRKAASQGDPNAQNNLGSLYANGQGVTQSYKEAAKWYRKAAEQGNANAQTSLGLIYYEGHIGQDYKEALKWFRKAAAQEEPNAKIRIGDMYAKGHGVTKNRHRASMWLSQITDAHIKAHPDLITSLAIGWWWNGDLKKACKLHEQGLLINPNNTSLLSNDMELAFVQGDRMRSQKRVDTLLNLLKPEEKGYRIALFYSWLQTPDSGYQTLLESINQYRKSINFGWDFCMTLSNIKTLPEPISSQALLFVDFFSRKITLRALEKALK